MRTLQRTLSTLALPLAVVACDAGAEIEGDEQALAESGETAVAGSSASAYMLGYFEGESSSDDESGLIVDISAAVEADVEVDTCLSTDTDGQSYLELTFNDCQASSGLRLDGAIRAELAAGPTSIGIDISTDGFVVGDTTIAGSWQLDKSFGLSTAIEWSGSTEIEGSLGGASLESTASASWDGACLTLDLAGSMGDREITVDDYQRCLGDCPISGEVTVSSSASGELSWTYDGGAIATVTGSVDGSFELELACDP